MESKCGRCERLFDEHTLRRAIFIDADLPRTAREIIAKRPI